MIDLRLLRRETDIIKKKITIKDPTFPIEELIKLDQEVTSKKIKIDSLLQQVNQLAERGKNGPTDEIRDRSKTLSHEIEQAKKEFNEIEKTFKHLYLSCPNIPYDGVPTGGKEANVVVKEWGTKPQFSFTPLSHYPLVLQNKWVNFEAATKISKTGFAYYENEAVDLMYQLCWWILQHNKSHGYRAVIPPYLANETTLTVAGNLPRFKEDLFVCEKDNLYLIPTSEVIFAGLYRDEILSASNLPIRLTALTSCFRREAGGYGAQEKGLIRMHQFEKVELFTLCEPKNSEEEHQKMIVCAEQILQKLNLPYRVVLLAGQDTSPSSAKTYDLEVWLPGQNEYREISSISNCTDFQARRAKTRYRENETLSYVYTLNGSSLALSRLMVALIETYQEADGTINYSKMIEKITTSYVENKKI